jgi:uncharacterized protein YajQ (UPF0234 family)
MTFEQIAALVLGSGAGGAVITKLVDHWLARGEKRQTRVDFITAANDKLAAQLREELRLELARRDVENQALRERLAEADARQRASDDRISQLFGQVSELNKLNQLLRDENLKLVRQSGEDSARVEQLARVNADQALKISVLENNLGMANDRINVLEDAMRKANIPIPESAAQRPSMGPQGPLATTPAGA